MTTPRPSPGARLVPFRADTAAAVTPASQPSPAGDWTESISTWWAPPPCPHSDDRVFGPCGCRDY